MPYIDTSLCPGCDQWFCACGDPYEEALHCPDCRGSGRTRDAWTCLACDGTGLHPDAQGPPAAAADDDPETLARELALLEAATRWADDCLPF